MNNFEGKNVLSFLKYVAKKKNTSVSTNVDNEKNLHPDSRKFIFLINLTEVFK